MSDSQRFPVACHVLGYLAHSGARSAETAVPSAILASSIGTNPVVVRRVTALLSQVGLIATRAGASGGAWLLKDPKSIGLDVVLRAVNGCAHLGVPPPGNKECPMGQHIPKVVTQAIAEADRAAARSLSEVKVADLIV
jgi:DNA-binding IscR family transcriptional regulator